MARQISNAAALGVLTEIFPLAEADFGAGTAVTGIPPDVKDAVEVMFQVNTQAYREALIGCAVARIVDQDIDIRLPATESGDNAFSGRALSDRIITPFMREHAVPISASPYLSALRGGAKFIPGGQPRIQRDQVGFDALVEAVAYLRKQNVAKAENFLKFLLRRFIELREQSNIGLRKIAKPTLDHISKLVDGLLKVKSGGRLPSMLAVAAYQTLSECHDLGWNVDFQGINVADAVTGAVGDITIKNGEEIVLGIEVTERPVPAARVNGIFEQKISPNGLDDYVILTSTKPSDEAFEAARKYAAIGHEINFVNLPVWIRNTMVTVGVKGRGVFQGKMIDLLSAPTTLGDMKVAWNACMDAAIAAAALDTFSEEGDLTDVFDVPTALRWDYDTMRLAAAREAVLSLGLLTPETEARIYHFLDARLTDHPRDRCRAWRAHGDQMTADEKRAAGIRANAFYSRDAYAELTVPGQARPMDAHDVTLLRAQFTVFRYLAVIQSRDVLEQQVGYYRHETLHMKCAACNEIDGREAPADEIVLFPPAACTCETANFGVTPHIDWLAGVE